MHESGCCESWTPLYGCVQTHSEDQLVSECPYAAGKADYERRSLRGLYYPGFGWNHAWGCCTNGWGWWDQDVTPITGRSAREMQSAQCAKSVGNRSWPRTSMAAG